MGAILVLAFRITAKFWQNHGVLKTGETLSEPLTNLSRVIRLISSRASDTTTPQVGIIVCCLSDHQIGKEFKV